MNKFHETPKPFEPSRIQGREDTGRRNFLKAAGALGAVVATAGLVYKTYESFSEDPMKEPLKVSLRELLIEMYEKKLESVPVVVTNLKESLLSNKGLVRLEKIIKAKKMDTSNPDGEISITTLEEFYKASK